MPAVTQNQRPARNPFAAGELLAADLQAFERYLATQRDSFEEEVRELVEYCLAHRGKRIRPVLVFLSAGRQGASEPVSELLVKAAAVVEMVHLATLIHDDILDEAEIRHQSPTIFQRHGPQIAVLLGDAFFAQALHLASDFPTVEVCRAVSRATRRVCSGELEQNFQKGKRQLSETHYFRIIELKTAELFRVSCLLGGLVSEQPQPVVLALEEFGRQLGIAYQMYDDLLDLFGREGQSGKTLGTDFGSGKWTLPLILYADQLPAREREQWVDRWASGDLSLAAVRSELISQGLDRVCADRFAERLRLSRQQLDAMPDNLRIALTPLADVVAEQVAGLLSLSD